MSYAGLSQVPVYTDIEKTSFESLVQKLRQLQTPSASRVIRRRLVGKQPMHNIHVQRRLQGKQTPHVVNASRARFIKYTPVLRRLRGKQPCVH